MANTTTAQASLTTSASGRQYTASGSYQRTMTGADVSIFTQTATTSWVVLAVPAAVATIGELLLVPGTPASGAGTLIQVALDNLGTNMVSDAVYIGQPLLVPYAAKNGGNFFYIKCDADTVPVQCFVSER